MLKQIFIITGEPRTGKSILFNNAFKAKHDEKVFSFLIDGYIICSKKDIKKLLSFIKEDLIHVDYLTIIVGYNKEKLQLLLIDSLKELEVPISICEMKRA